MLLKISTVFTEEKVDKTGAGREYSQQWYLNVSHERLAFEICHQQK
jgi:hypothetical protein